MVIFKFNNIFFVLKITTTKMFLFYVSLVSFLANLNTINIMYMTRRKDCTLNKNKRENNGASFVILEHLRLYIFIV